ncbi:hypothetical protein [Croceiramulus getboli]|nr:hypothetical protein P8624_14370 [Flavobacteriaceae bacterium YJPT1-3]
MIKNTILLFACLISTVLVAQETTDTSTDKEATIGGQYTEMIESSNSYQDYKVIKKYKLNAFEANLKKEIDGLNAEIESLQSTIDNQESQLESIKQELATTQNSLAETRSEKDSISFLGSQMSKTGYKGLMWGIIAVLLAGLLFFFYRFRNSIALTKEAKKKLDETEMEFDDYRKKALEKEQKMGRLLQDERNKLLKSTKG